LDDAGCSVVVINYSEEERICGCLSVKWSLFSAEALNVLTTHTHTHVPLTALLLVFTHAAASSDLQGCGLGLDLDGCGIDL